MCGIIGFYNKHRPQHSFKALMEQGLLVDSLRGTCGSGVAGITDKGEVSVFKKALAGPDFIQHDTFAKYLANFDNYSVHLGHNRAATRGSAIDSNAHPFHVKIGEGDEIVLIHNGTISNFNKVSPNNWHHDVDSAHAAAGMSAFGELATLEACDGWFVFVWVNATTKTFNIARSNNKDIAVIHSPDKQSLLFASEYKMLDFLSSRNGIKTSDTFIAPGEYEWWQWDMTDKTVTRVHKRQFKKFAHPVITYPANRFNTRAPVVSPDAETAIKELGFTLYDDMFFHVTGFRKYAETTKSYGEVLGEDWESTPPVPVKVRSVSQADFDELYNHPEMKDYIAGRPLGVETSATGEKALIVRCFENELRRELQERKEAARKRVDALPIIKAEAKVESGEQVVAPDAAAVAGRTLPTQETKAQEANNTGTDQGPGKENTGGGAAELKALPAPLDRTYNTVRACSLPGVEVSVPGPKGELISLEEFEKYASDGCTQCSGPIAHRDFRNVAWVGEYQNQPLCHSCTSELRDYLKAERQSTR